MYSNTCNVTADCFSRQGEWRFALADYEQALDLALEPERELRKRALVDEIHMRLALTHYMIGTSLVEQHQVMFVKIYYYATEKFNLLFHILRRL